MATRRQVAANRKNAKRSTGPRTGVGKERSSTNSIKHGLLAQSHPIAGEDPQERSKFEERIRADLKPEGGFEECLVDRIIKDTWRLNRFDNVEGALLENLESLDDLSISEALDVLRFFSGESGRAFDRLFEEYKFLTNNERNLQTLAQNKLDPGSVRESRLVGAAKFARLTDERNALESILVKNIIDRLGRPARAATQSTLTGAQMDGAEGERTTPLISADINKIARSFARNRVQLELALRYRTRIERSRDNALHELERRQAARQGQLVPTPEVVDVNVNFSGKDEDRN
jgi:hypothetical protein